MKAIENQDENIFQSIKMKDFNTENKNENQNRKKLREDCLIKNENDRKHYTLKFTRIVHTENIVNLFLETEVKKIWIKINKDSFYYFDDKWYEIDSNRFRNKMSEYFIRILDECITDDYGVAYNKIDQKTMKMLYNRFGNLQPIINLLPIDDRRNYENFNKDKNILLFNDNKYFDMKTKEIKDLTYDIKITHELPFSSNVLNINEDKFTLDYFTSLFNCEETAKKMIDIIYTAISGNKMRHLIALWGVGRNGKSIMLNLLFDIFGEWVGVISERVFISDTLKKVHNDELVAVCEKRIGFFTEPKEGSHLCEETIKRITGGDKIRIRDLGKSSYQAEPTSTLFLSCNKPPKMSNSQSIEDRLLTFHFCNRFEKSIEYEENLKKKYPEILSYILRHGKIISTVDFTENMLQAKEYIVTESDIIEQYLIQSGDYEKDEKEIFNQADFKRDIHAWAKHQGIFFENKDKLNMSNLYEALDKKGYKLQPRNKKYKKPRIGLKRTNNADIEDYNERWD